MKVKKQATYTVLQEKLIHGLRNSVPVRKLYACS